MYLTLLSKVHDSHFVDASQISINEVEAIKVIHIGIL